MNQITERVMNVNWERLKDFNVSCEGTANYDGCELDFFNFKTGEDVARMIFESSSETDGEFLLLDENGDEIKKLPFTENFVYMITVEFIEIIINKKLNKVNDLLEEKFQIETNGVLNSKWENIFKNMSEIQELVKK